MCISQGWVQRATPTDETVDITRTEHNHSQDQGSNEAKKLVSSMRKRQYSLCDHVDSTNWTLG